MPRSAFSLLSQVIGLLIVFGLVRTCRAFYLHPENTTEAIHITSPQLVYLGPPEPDGGWNITTLLVQGIPGATRPEGSTVPPIDLNGLALIMLLPSHKSTEDVIAMVNGRGVVALFIVSISSVPGWLEWNRNSIRPNQPFPVFEVSGPDNDILKLWFNNQTNHSILISIAQNDPNPWDPTYHLAIPIFAIPLLITNGILLIMAVFKLFILVSQHGLRLHVAQVIFIMAILSATIRIIFFAIDPFEAWGIANHFFTAFLVDLSSPFEACSTLLLSLYWHEMISKTGPRMNNPWLVKMKWPFVGVSCFLLIIAIVAGVLRGLRIIVPRIVMLTSLLYLPILLFVIIFFIVTRIRLKFMFSQITAIEPTSRARKLQFASSHLFVMSFLLVIWLAIIFVFGAATYLIFTPIGFPVVMAIYLTNLTAITYLQLRIVRVRRKPLKTYFCGLCYPEYLALSDDTDTGASSTKGTDNATEQSEYQTNLSEMFIEYDGV